MTLAQSRDPSTAGLASLPAVPPSQSRSSVTSQPPPRRPIIDQPHCRSPAVQPDPPPSPNSVDLQSPLESLAAGHHSRRRRSLWSSPLLSDSAPSPILFLSRSNQSSISPLLAGLLVTFSLVIVPPIVRLAPPVTKLREEEDGWAGSPVAVPLNCHGVAGSHVSAFSSSSV